MTTGSSGSRSPRAEADPAIRIVDADPAWQVLGADEAARIAAALGGGVVVEHIGSTAVPGLASKPIIDLMAMVDDLTPLTLPAYTRDRSAGDAERHFYARPFARPRTHHLHVVRAGGAVARSHLAVRDYLRAHADEAAAYEAVKRRAAAAHPGDRLAYIADKDPFLVELEVGALRWRPD